MKAYRAARLVTCAQGLGVVEDGVLAFEGTTLTYVGPAADYAGETVNVPLITPGLIDAHTHAAWVGSRHDEYMMRLAGAAYVDIAKAGGGIQASQRAVAAATQEEIERTLEARLRRMTHLGVTTVEVKSGYGLLPEHELKQLRAVAAVRARPKLPRIVPTALLLHALPSIYREDRKGYVTRMCEECLPRVAEEGLAAFVDAYVDANAFTTEEAALLAERARSLGIGIRLHVGQFADIGGAELAARVGAASADHLEHVSESGARALAEAGVIAGILPTACFTLGQAPPPIATLRAVGVRMMVASDANPGTAPTESLPLAMAIAARSFSMTLEEVVLGVTLHAAAALRLPSVGSLQTGFSADFVAWDLPHEACLLQPWGSVMARSVVARGDVLV